MADVFISYKSERRAAAEHLAEVLADYGYSVWWDYGLVSGRDFGVQIETELRAAKAVVILWCTLSRHSEWVLDEASLAKTLGSAIPAMIERVELPLGFGRTQTLDLTDWDGAPQSHTLERLLRDIAGKVGRAPAPHLDGLDRTERAWRRFGAPSLAQFALTAPLERTAPARVLPGDLKPRGAPGPVAPPKAQQASRWIVIGVALIGLALGAGGAVMSGAIGGSPMGRDESGALQASEQAAAPEPASAQPVETAPAPAPDAAAPARSQRAAPPAEPAPRVERVRAADGFFREWVLDSGPNCRSFPWRFRMRGDDVIQESFDPQRGWQQADTPIVRRDDPTVLDSPLEGPIAFYRLTGDRIEVAKRFGQPSCTLRPNPSPR